MIKHEKFNNEFISWHLLEKVGKVCLPTNFDEEAGKFLVVDIVFEFKRFFVIVVLQTTETL